MVLLLIERFVFFSNSIEKIFFLYLKQFNAFYNFPLIWFIMFRYFSLFCSIQTMHKVLAKTTKGRVLLFLLIITNCLELRKSFLI